MSEPSDVDSKRAALRARYMSDTHGEAMESTLHTGGVDHLALICSDIEATVRFYTEVLKMRLIRVVPNRDEPTSTHIFLDMGGGNRLAFFDFPNASPAKTVRGVGSMHHVALKATPEHFQAVIAGLEDHALAHSVHRFEQHASVYFRDPDGILLEVTTGH